VSRPPRRRSAVAGWTLVAALIGGCTMSGTGNAAPDDVVELARTMVRTVGEAQGDVLGDDASTLDREVRGPTSCTDDAGGERTYRASLHWVVVLPEDAEVTGVLERLRDHLEGQGLEADVEAVDGSQPRVQARGGDGTGYAAEVVRETLTLHWLASTACAPIPADREHVSDLDDEFLDLVDPDGEIVETGGEGSLAERVARVRESSSP
jgi:hypothetical protein